MVNIYAILTLLDDTILSRQSKSVDMSETLTYIPGRVLLGAVASRLYMELKDEPERQFSVFHGGGVRFFDARPVVKDNDGTFQPTFSIPLSFHHLKGLRKTFSIGGIETLSDNVENFAFESRPSEGQYKQCRALYMTEKMRVHSVAKNSSLRTALDGGQVLDKYLFGYDAIRKGTQFLATLQVEDENIADRVCQILKRGIRVGRSKTAEYGRVHVEILKDLPQPKPAAGTPNENDVSIYFASDVAIRNQWGNPSLNLDVFARKLNADGWVKGKTFVRTRQYSPFNGVRYRHDLERQVWTMGSVVTLRYSGGVDIASLRKQVEEGFGDYINEGLGELWIQPEFLSRPKPNLEPKVQQTNTGSSTVRMPASLSWLAAHKEKRNYDLTVAEVVENWMTEFMKFPNIHRRISTSQWSNIRQMAQMYGEDADLVYQLFGEGGKSDESTGYVFTGKRKLKSTWGATSLGSNKTIAEVFQSLVKTHIKSASQARLSDVVRTVAKRMRDKSRDISGGDEA